MYYGCCTIFICLVFFFLVSKPCFAQAASTVVSDVDLPKVRHWSASWATGSQTLWPGLGKNALENFIEGGISSCSPPENSGKIARSLVVRNATPGKNDPSSNKPRFLLTPEL